MARRRVFISVTFSRRSGQTGVIPPTVRACLGLCTGPLSVPRESHPVFFFFFSAHSIRAPQNAELLTQATGQGLRCNCSRSNRLNKLVIHTPTTACGCQREEEKNAVIIERWKDLSFSKCSLQPVLFMTCIFQQQAHKPTPFSLFMPGVVSPWSLCAPRFLLNGIRMT